MKTQTILKRLFLPTLCALVLLALTPGSALTQSEKTDDKSPKPKESPTVAGPALKQSVVAGGGGVSSGGSYRLEATVGQPVASADASNGNAYALRAGFWPGAIPCPFTMTETARLYNSGGGASALKVIATGDCSWTVNVSAPWINLTTASSGIGSDVIAYEVRENFTGAARQATITVGDYTNTIVQDGNIGVAACGYAISPSFVAFTNAGGAASINVTAAAGCAWNAESDEEWITITSGRLGIGNGTVTYVVAPTTPGLPRNGSIRIAGKTFAVKQQK